jgi:hypothetical protein
MSSKLKMTELNTADNKEDSEDDNQFQKATLAFFFYLIRAKS